MQWRLKDRISDCSVLLPAGKYVVLFVLQFQDPSRRVYCPQSACWIQASVVETVRGRRIRLVVPLVAVEWSMQAKPAKNIFFGKESVSVGPHSEGWSLKLYAVQTVV